MRIVLTVHQFFPDFAAGTEILTLDTAKELQRRGHEVLIWTAYPGDGPDLVDFYEYDGIKVHRYYYNQNKVAQSSDIVAVEYCNKEFEDCFNKFLGQYKPDVIHFFHLSRLSATAIHSGFSNNIPMVFTATDFWMVCPTNQLRLPNNSPCLGPDKYSVNCLRHLIDANMPDIYKKIKCFPDWVYVLGAWATKQTWWTEKQYSPLVASLTRRIGYLSNAINLLDRVLVPTKLMNEMLVRHGLDRTKAVYVPYGINLDHIQKVPSKNPSPNLRLGFIGTLYEHKGPHVLIEAINLLPKDAPIELKIYGKEHEFPEYVAYLKELAGSDSRISFCGTFPNHEIGRIFSELDVLVVPSIWYENTPLVIYSAQATKTPVIATNLGGMAEAVEHEKNGLLFEKGNAVELAEQIKRLVDNRKLILSLSENSKAPKSIPTYVDELEGVYQSILSERRKH